MAGLTVLSCITFVASVSSCMPFLVYNDNNKYANPTYHMFDSNVSMTRSTRHDLEVNGGKGLIVDPRTKYVYHRP